MRGIDGTGKAVGTMTQQVGNASYTGPAERATFSVDDFALPCESPPAPRCAHLALSQLDGANDRPPAILDLQLLPMPCEVRPLHCASPAQLALALGVPLDVGAAAGAAGAVVELPPESPVPVAAGLDVASVDDGLVSVFSAEDDGLLALALPYPSAYQPPPFSKNPVPPEISRFALFLPHDTHFLSGRSLIDCSASHWWPQASHAYS
jgi:hypothetical protein